MHAIPRRGHRSLLAALVCAPLIATSLAPALGHAQPADTSKRISTRPLFTRNDLWVAAGFAAGTVAMFPLDKRFARRLQDPETQENRFFRHQATNLRIIGEPGTLIIGSVMWGVGRTFGIDKMADLGLHGTEAVLLGVFATAAGKALVGRARPYDDLENPRNFGFGRGLEEDRYRSFPSGHSTMGFAAAAAVSAETARWWPQTRWIIGPAMYGGAALIGASRMYNNKHWASDVVMGATIGTFAGLKVVRYHHSHPNNRIDRWLLGARVAPSPDGGMALALAVTPTLIELPRRPPSTSASAFRTSY